MFRSSPKISSQFFKLEIFQQILYQIMETEVEYQCSHDKQALLMCIAEDCSHSSKLACRKCLVSLHSHNRILLRRLNQDQASICEYTSMIERKQAISNLLRKSGEKIKEKISHQIDNFVANELGQIDAVLPWFVSEIYEKFTSKGRQLDSPYAFRASDYPIKKVDEAFNKYLDLIKTLNELDWSLPQTLLPSNNPQNLPELPQLQPDILDQLPTKPQIATSQQNSTLSDNISTIPQVASSTNTSLFSLTHQPSLKPQEPLVDIPEERCHSNPSLRRHCAEAICSPDKSHFSMSLDRNSEHPMESS